MPPEVAPRPPNFRAPVVEQYVDDVAVGVLDRRRGPQQEGPGEAYAVRPPPPFKAAPKAPPQQGPIVQDFENVRGKCWRGRPSIGYWTCRTTRRLLLTRHGDHHNSSPRLGKFVCGEPHGEAKPPPCIIAHRCMSDVTFTKPIFKEWCSSAGIVLAEYDCSTQKRLPTTATSCARGPYRAPTDFRHGHR